MGDLTYTESASTLTWSFWLNPATVAATDCLWCKYNNAASQRSWAIETGTTNASGIRVTIPTSTSEADGTTYGETPTGQLTASTWTHITVVYDGTATGNANRLKIYINGVKQNLTFAGTIPASTQATTSNALVGESSDGARNFPGTIDEMKLYGGALTQSELLVDYNQSQALVLGALGTDSSNPSLPSNSSSSSYCVPGDTTSCAPPVHEWTFEEKKDTTGNDTGTTVQAGTLTGGPIPAIGKFGQGLQFDGLDDYIDGGNPSSLNIGSSITMAVWIKTSNPLLKIP